MRSVLTIITQPFEFLFLRLVQWEYKRVTNKNIGNNHTNRVLSYLTLLMHIEEYYYSQYSPWGKFHPDCSVGKNHEKQMEWLFPKKDFEEIDIVLGRCESHLIRLQNTIWLNHKRKLKPTRYLYEGVTYPKEGQKTIPKKPRGRKSMKNR